MANRYFYLIPSNDNNNGSVLVNCSYLSTRDDGRYYGASYDKKVYGAMFRPTTKEVTFKNAVWKSENFCFKFSANDRDIIGAVGSKNGWEAPDYVDVFMDGIDKNANFLKFNSNGDLVLCKHTKGNWSAKIGQWYFPKKNAWDYIRGIFISSAGESYKEYTIKGGGGVPSWELNGATDAGWRVNITLNYTEEVLATKGNYDIGADYSGENIGSSYCFYCTDKNNKYWLDYLVKYPYTTVSNNTTKPHSCTKHNETPKQAQSFDTSAGTDNGYKYESYNSNTKYSPNATASSASLGKVERLAYGTTGTYVDGVANVPFIMIELRPSEDSEVGYNISLPTTSGKGMSSVVSLTHERNMADSYNTFVLQIFDRDAMEVEAKLLLGFRYITFYYTDFVSTSKRFKGEVLNYKTTIAGKGLMLTIDGYSSNVNTYIGKDSIPWSVLCQSGEPSFYYWMNKAGEYHGEVRVAESGEFNSSEGEVVRPRNIAIEEIHNYYLKVPVEEKDEDGNTTGSGTEWRTFDEYYEDVDEETKDKFRPTPHKWTLSTNGYNAQLENVLADDDVQLSDMRPSDIVKMICIINKWSYKIVQTKKVTEIPDQISMGYVEYIKEKLIPISVSEGKKSSTQYYFWFDDDGVAHYEPYNASENGVKKLYFNSVEHPDSYPLIGFTSATNGSVLMVTDATNSMEAINAYTGDELSLSTVSASTNDPDYLSTVVETAEWYSTNKLTRRDRKDLQLISYSNKSTLPSEEELKNQLIYRWGTVSRYTYKAQLEVYGCADLTPGNYVDVYIYLDDGARSNGDVAEESEYWRNLNNEYESSKTYNEDGTYNAKLMYWDEEKHYSGNLTMHHSSGRYIINKITDTISAGKYVSSLEVLKVDKNKVLDMIEYNSETETENKKSENVGSSGFSSDSGNGGGGGGGSGF